MTQKYCLFDILQTEKNMVVNMAIALNEASNDNLYQEFLKMFENISLKTKKLFSIAYEKEWYTLENEEEKKITKEISKLKKELNKKST